MCSVWTPESLYHGHIESCSNPVISFVLHALLFLTGPSTPVLPVVICPGLTLELEHVEKEGVQVASQSL